MIVKGEKRPDVVIGGYDKDMVASAPFGPGASEAGKNAATTAIADLKAGTRGAWSRNFTGALCVPAEVPGNACAANTCNSTLNE